MNIVYPIPYSIPNVCEIPVFRSFPENCFCIQQNIRSMRKNFSNFLAHIESLKKLPVVIVLTEIWVFENEMCLYNIPGYALFSCCNESYSSGGVAIYIDESLAYQCSKIEICSADVVKLSFCYQNENYTMLCIYRLHAFSKSVYMDEISQILSKFNNCNLILIGDINIDILNTSDKDVENYLFLMASNGLKCNIKEPTRVTPASSTCIDHIFSRFGKNNKFNFCGSVLDYKITDHRMIVLEINSIENNISNSNTLRDKEHLLIDYTLLQDILKHEFWDQVYSEKYPSTSFNVFSTILQSHINACSTVSMKNSKKKFLKPWMNHRLLKQIKNKNRVSTKLKKYPNNTKLQKYYLSLCKAVKINVELMRENYYSNLFERSKGNVKEEWRIIDSILGKNRKSNSIGTISVDGIQVTDFKCISNKFNEYFTEISEKLKPSIESYADCNCSNQRSLDREYLQPNSFVFSAITSFETYKIIISLENKNSCTSDGISSNILKKIAFYVSDVLDYIFNLSVERGCFPQQFKCAILKRR